MHRAAKRPPSAANPCVKSPSLEGMAHVPFPVPVSTYFSERQRFSCKVSAPCDLLIQAAFLECIEAAFQLAPFREVEGDVVIKSYDLDTNKYTVTTSPNTDEATDVEKGKEYLADPSWYADCETE